MPTRFNLPPSGSLLLFLSRKPILPSQPAAETVAVIQSSQAPEIRRLEPNVLTLDYVEVSAGGETRQGLSFYQANQFAWQKNGVERNPWDSAVQFKDELISRKFAPGSGFEASYRFQLEGDPPANLGADWNSQGHSFYGGGVAYREHFRVGQKTGRYAVALRGWYGSVAKVSVRGRARGYLDAPPWECDVTKWIRPG